MVFSDTMYIDLDAFDISEITEYLKNDYPQILYLKYRKDVKYLDVVCSDKINNMYVVYQKLIKFQEIAWEKYVAQAWIQLRKERNKRLQESDWTQLEDAKKSMPEEIAKIWVLYRQYLRDLPNNTLDPFNPVWPTIPHQS
jgi:Phage tail assembly chaperone protein